MFTDQEKVADYYGGTVMTRGVSIAVHATAEVDIQLISDHPTDDFTVDAVDAAVFSGGSPELTFAWDKTTGKNGDVLKLTITRSRAGQLPGSEFLLEAKNRHRRGFAVVGLRRN